MFFFKHKKFAKLSFYIKTPNNSFLQILLTKNDKN